MYSEDQWRHVQGAPPHAPGLPVTPGLPMGGSGGGGSGMLLGGGGGYSYAPTGGSGSGGSYGGYSGYAVGTGGTEGLNVITALFVLVFCGPVLAVLYPFATGLGFLIERVADTRLAPFVSDPLTRRLIALLAGVVAYWTVSRIDHRAATLAAPYRWARHLLRLLLIGAFVVAPAGQWVPASAAEARALLTARAVPLLVTVLIAHFILTRKSLRGLWHGALEVLRLRPRDLPGT